VKRLLVVVMLLSLLLPGCIKLGSGSTADKTPKVHVFQSLPDSVEQGKQVMLSWEVSDASSITIQPGIGVVEPLGSKQVTVTAPTVYTLTATNRYGKTEKTASVAVGIAGGAASDKPPAQGGQLPPVPPGSANPPAPGGLLGGPVPAAPGSPGGLPPAPSGTLGGLPPADNPPNPGPSATVLPSLMQPGNQGSSQSLGSLQALIPADAVRASGAGNLQAIFYALPNPVISGQNARLYWNTTNASRVDLLDDYNEFVKKDVDKSGNYDVVLSKTTTYKLRVTGPSVTLDLRYTVKIQ
jgi:hypothetical protein